MPCGGPDLSEGSPGLLAAGLVILVDTSAWVEYDRATGSAVDRRLLHLVADEGPIATTEPVVMELTAGARSQEREQDLRRLLLRFHLLGFDAVVDFAAAASIYRECRRVAVTPRGLIDCMILSVARRHGASFLTVDADMRRVAGVIGVALDQVTETG